MPRDAVRPQTYLVEYYGPGLDADALERNAARLRSAAAELRREGKQVRHLRSTIIAADESLLCLFEAGSGELVRMVYARAGVPFDRISAAISVDDAGAAVNETNQRREDRT
jgi:hypothetical protein